MALKGTLTQYYKWSSGNLVTTSSSSGAGLAVIFDWNCTGQSVVSGTSDISYTIKVKNISLSAFNEYNNTSYDTITFGGSGSDTTNKDIVVYFDNVQKYSNDGGSGTQIKVGNTATVATGTASVSHNSDGSKSPAIKIEWWLGRLVQSSNSSYTTYNKKFTVNTSFSLDPIAMHAIMTGAENFNDEQSPNVSYAIPSGMTGYIYLSLDGTGATEDTHLMPVTGEGTSQYVFNSTDKEKLWTILASSTNKAVKFFIKSTFQGEVYREGSEWVNLEIINYMPTLDPTITEADDDVYNRLTGNRNKLVRYVSNAAFTTGGSAKKGATIDIQTTTNGGTPKNGASGVFEKVTSERFYFHIRDSHGRQSSVEKFLAIPNEWVEYVKLTVSVDATPMTAEGDVQVKITGKCFTGDFGIKTNRLRVNYDIAKNNGEYTMVDLGYADLASRHGNSFEVDGNDYTYTLNISGLEYLSVYDLRVRVSDEVAVEGVEVPTILASVPIFDWSRTDFAFNVPVTIQGAQVPTIQAQGTAGIWTYRTWSDGTAECWGKKDFTVNVTSQWGNMYTSGAISGSNVSFPFGLFAATPVVNASLLVRSAGGILMAPGGAGSNIANMDQTGVYEIARGTSLSNAAYTINYQVIGRWK